MILWRFWKELSITLVSRLTFKIFEAMCFAAFLYCSKAMDQGKDNLK